jgi:hypothetical protein
VIIKLDHGGQSYAYDDDSLTVQQGIAIEEHIKGTLIDFHQGLRSHRSACFQALGWLVFQDGALGDDGHPVFPIAKVNFPIGVLSAAWLEALQAFAAELKAEVDAAEADAEAMAGPAKAAPAGPTGAPGSSPRSGSTSPRSPSSSATRRATSTPSGSASSTT